MAFYLVWGPKTKLFYTSPLYGINQLIHQTIYFYLLIVIMYIYNIIMHQLGYVIM